MTPRALGLAAFTVLTGCAAASPPVTINATPVIQPPCALGDAADCRARCDERDNESCNRLVDLYAREAAEPPDPQVASDLVEAMCAQGNAIACRLLGSALLGARGRKREPKLAEAAFARGCERGDIASCGLVAKARFDRDAAREACRRGAIEACAFIEEHGRRIQLSTAQCKAGDFGVCADLGEALLHAPDAATGVWSKLLERACSGGSTRGCRSLARAEADAARAERLLRKACNEGDPSACLDLAKRLEARGLHGESERSRGRDLLERACERRDFHACLELGDASHDDAPRAEGFFRQACDGKLVEGCIGLGKVVSNTTEEAANDALEAFDTGCELEATERTIATPRDLISCQRACELRVVLRDSPRARERLERSCQRALIDVDDAATVKARACGEALHRDDNGYWTRVNRQTSMASTKELLRVFAKACAPQYPDLAKAALEASKGGRKARSRILGAASGAFCANVTGALSGRDLVKACPPVKDPPDLIIWRELDAGTYAFTQLLKKLGLTTTLVDELILQASMNANLDK
jgi:hypothetical protein